jgi:hypothetical protein
MMASIDFLRINPRLSAVQIANIGRFVNSATSIEARRAKVSVALDMLRANPNAFALN